jgi:xanthine phosphoribosyltransferase
MDKEMHFDNINELVHNIMRQVTIDLFRPDYVVGITRGGLVPALMISHYLNIPMHTLKVSLRSDPPDTESNGWMAEDAFGYVSPEDQAIIKSRWDPKKRKNILIVDDINDSGATFDWIKQDWIGSCFPDEKEVWNSVWNHNVKFAVLVDNEASSFEGIDYFGEAINKVEDPIWIRFPWERWWK